MTLSSFSAIVKTDIDKTVVVATLEAMQELLKELKKLSFVMKDETMDAVSAAIQDILESNVSETLFFLVVVVPSSTETCRR